MRIGNKKIYHLEAWVVKVMNLYKVGLFFLLIDVVKRLSALFLRL